MARCRIRAPYRLTAKEAIILMILERNAPNGMHAIDIVRQSAEKLWYPFVYFTLIGLEESGYIYAVRERLFNRKKYFIRVEY